MTNEELFAAWVGARQSARAWTTLTSGASDDEAIVRAVGATVLQSADPADLARVLIEQGEFDEAGLLLVDDIGDLSPATLAELDAMRRARIEQARAEISTRAEELVSRARDIRETCDTSAIIRAAGEQRAAAQVLLQAETERIKAAEERVAASLRALLERRVESTCGDEGEEQWREAVHRAIDRGAFDAARDMIDTGPVLDRSPVRLPRAPRWPHGPELATAIDWFLDPEAMGPPTGDFRLARDDDNARGFLEALRRLLSVDDERNRHDVVLTVARLLGGRVSEIETSPSSATARLDALEPPGFLPLGCYHWAPGCPLTLAVEGTAPDFEPNALGIRLVRHRGAQAEPPWLNLSFEEILAVLSDREGRRQRLFVPLGPQIPLIDAFADIPRSRWVHWGERALPLGKSVLYVGAPGMGKASLLAHLATKAGALRVDAQAIDDLELPDDATCVLLETPADGDVRGLRRLVRELYWLADTNPSIGFGLTARPEIAQRIKQLAPDQFHIELLGPRPLAALREEAVVALEWLDVHTLERGLYDRLALLASGNPTVLRALCRALVATLGEGERAFDARHVERAWNSQALRQAIRQLLWVPLSESPGRLRLLRLIVDFVQPGDEVDDFEALVELADEDDLASSLGATWRDHLEVLQRYGLLETRSDERGLSVRRHLGGLNQLIPNWLEAPNDAK